ncbi:MAG: 50S ribosomal protein L27 [Candidatus Omnitrophica bacterium]|nr:50S ribosomal protein L27 [Candidatus Omnitrophota bacterium]
MAKVGGLSKINYKETRGIKVAGGSKVKAGTVLTRQGDKWKPGINVAGRMHLTAACDGEVYFEKKRGTYKKTVTFVNIRPVEKTEKKKTVKKVASK